MNVRLILGDQLNVKHSWFQNVDPHTIYVFFEMRQETDYVTHHIQKIIGFFAAMRNFEKELSKQGHKTFYLKLDDPNNRQQLTENLAYVFSRFDATTFAYQHPDEYRLDEQLKVFSKTLVIPVDVHDTEHFLSTRDEMAQFFEGKKKFVMEFFYRYMRKNSTY